MAVLFVAAGALASNATTVTLPVVAPACAVDDILICAIHQRGNQVISAPDGTWTKIVGANHTAAMRAEVFWKRATGSGGSFTFTKPVDDNLLFCGVISAWRGCVVAPADPIDATAPTVSLNASGDTVTYASFDPTRTGGHVVALGFYNEDLTTAGSIAGTNPLLTSRFDLETGTGADGSIFGYSGDSDGAVTGQRSHSTTSTADAISIGVLFGLVARIDMTLTDNGDGSLTIEDRGRRMVWPSMEDAKAVCAHVGGDDFASQAARHLISLREQAVKEGRNPDSPADLQTVSGSR